ncbi:Pkinase-domain-containing protein [Aspergillus steynii IBT 23096]|uniref:Pkinase-domain-containing protein n=1 Tax=Aspergillus steynii IBT 23096 TaxID=1392250 RepID=A0A2I2GFM6_9EURO|nr:Pkinase-domain-containing protein [Aspergillus steynii IBT 23096]PLB51661.1 Pkinase-domain-containing protein [Aspergillus steynii IBT 23096]
MSGLAEIIQETPSEGPSDSQVKAQTSNEISFAEVMEQYDIKTNFHQQYRVIQQLGKGHFATVYLCANRVTDVACAVKTFKTLKSLASSGFNDPLIHEIQLLRELRNYYHPNLMRMINVFADFEKNNISLVFNLAEEGELFNWIVSKQKLTENETRRVFRQLISAIQFLHGRGWVHRDIKPENILVLDKSLTIQLGDFGVAKQIRTEPSLDELTTTLCGTPSYVAPEILQETVRRRYGFGVDVWSCGVVLYICLCGFPPFSDELYSRESPYTLAQQIRMGRFDYPSPYWDDIPDSALDLIGKMLTVDASKRISPSKCLCHPWMCDTPWPAPEIPADAEKALSLRDQATNLDTPWPAPEIPADVQKALTLRGRAANLGAELPC